MIVIYSYRYSNKKLNQVIDWMNNHKLNYQILTKDDLKKSVLKEMLKVSEDGFDEIVISSKKSKVVQAFSELINFEVISTNTFLNLLIRFPELLKELIIFDEHKLLTGYNTDDIRKFLPRIRNESYTNYPKI